MPWVTGVPFPIGKKLSTVLKPKGTNKPNPQITSFQVRILGSLSLPIVYHSKSKQDRNHTVT